jgi:ABC-type sulfate/molybdate transport systems ATPase subunit
MDEPLVHVDPARAGDYWAAIREHLVAARGSLVFATHVPETVLSEATRVICLREGRVLHTGSAAELYATPPSAELMNFLGPGNWLTADEARGWFGLELPAPRCFRPEQLAIAAAENSPLLVTAARFMGSIAEVEISHGTARLSHHFFHRPSGASLRPGMRVALRLLPE